MLIKNCVIKHWEDSIWLHHTASDYKVRMNPEALGVLEDMAARVDPAEMTEKEKFIYDKLAAKGIAGKDTGCEEDRRIIIKTKSCLGSVELEFSGRCNLRCTHCLAALSREDMSRETLNKVFAGIDSLEPVALTIGGGEPLLNPLLPEALMKARERRMCVTVMTNATLVSEETADLLKESGVGKAVVSLDFFEDTHDAIRGRGAFNKTIAGIKLFVSRKVPVSIMAMVQESTAPRREEFRNFCINELGVSWVKFSAIIPIGNAKDAPAEMRLSPAKTKELFNLGLLPPPGENAGVHSKLSGSRNFYCKAGVEQCFVSADGRVYPCHLYQNTGEAMGNLADKSFETIYREYQNSGAIPVDFDWEKLKKCKACAHFAKCQGGCRARARILSGVWYEPDPYSCDMFGVE